jgi:hypothetical protein
MEQAILDHLVANEVMENTQQFAASNGFNHEELVGVVKSLASDNFVFDTPVAQVGISEEGRQYLDVGSPEA